MTDLQRQIRRARISQVLSAVPAVIFAALFVVHIASGAIFLDVLNAVTVALFAASIAITTARIRIMRRTLSRAGASLPASAAPVLLPPQSARERALRHITRRPRRIMTPGDYKRLRELEAELGWEPSEVPGSLASGGVVALEPRKPAACDCNEPRVVQVRVPESATPVASYCAECGRKWKRHESKAARPEVLTAEAKVSYGGTAALSGSGTLSAKARLTDGEVKDATEAAQHFEQLARVGRDHCTGFCPICHDFDRNAREAEPGFVQARLPEKSRKATLATLEPGCPRYTVPWAMRADEDGRMWLNLSCPAWSSPGGTATMRVERREDGYHVWPVRDYGYTLEAFDVRLFMPVAVLEGDR